MEGEVDGSSWTPPAGVDRVRSEEIQITRMEVFGWQKWVDTRVMRGWRRVVIRKGARQLVVREGSVETSLAA